MIALAWAIGAGSGLILGFFLAAMLLYRNPVQIEDPMAEPNGDVPWRGER